MKDGITVTMQGDKEMIMFLNRLPMSFTKKFMENTLKNAGRGAVKSVRSATVEGPTGNLKRSIGIKLVRGNGPFVFSSIIGARMSRRGGKYGKGYHAHLYAYGNPNRKGGQTIKGKGEWISDRAERHIPEMNNKMLTEVNKNLNKSIAQYNRRWGTNLSKFV